MKGFLKVTVYSRVMLINIRQIVSITPANERTRITVTATDKNAASIDYYADEDMDTVVLRIEQMLS